MIYTRIKKNILKELKEANDTGTPITLTDATKRWGKSLTWKDLVDSDYINLLSEAVTVTASGLKYLEE